MGQGIDMEINYEIHQLKTRCFFIANYSYIILDNVTKDAVIIDPAWEIKKVTAMLSLLEARLVAIALTHSHHDHVNLVGPLVKQFNPTVYMSRIEIDYYRFNCKNIQPVDDMDIIRVGKTEVSCMLTPGHTAGGMCYLLPDSIFTGDTIFTEGCGICGFDGGSAEEMYHSIQRIKSEIPSNVSVYPGHSYGMAPGHTIERLREQNIYFQIGDIKKFVDFRMRKNQKNLFNFK
jgi:glyoxylase-like metal-dependent hydrolase (beta-lactamase superfamily II)